MRKKSYEVGILFGFDKDRDARKYCLKLIKKYENNDSFIFLDLSNFKRKESKIKIFSNFSKVCFGIHSCEEDYSPINVELEFCDKGIVSDLALYLKEKNLVDNLVSFPYEIWKLREYPINFGILEIFRGRNTLSRFEQLLLQTSDFIKMQK